LPEIPSGVGVGAGPGLVGIDGCCEVIGDAGAPHDASSVIAAQSNGVRKRFVGHPPRE